MANIKNTARPELVVDEKGEKILGADPHVLLADDGYFYMYTTFQFGELPTWRSKDLKSWEKLPSALSPRPYLDTGDADGAKPKLLWQNWGPDVYRFGDGYVMFICSYVSSDEPTKHLPLEMSVFAAYSEKPTGPFERFVKIMPRDGNPHGPHSVINDDPPEVMARPDYDHHAVFRVDAYMLTDPVTGRDYLAYTSYGSAMVDGETGNHIHLFWFKNPRFEDGPQGPGLYYDYVPEERYYLSNPHRWPEFDVPTCLDKYGQPWRPTGKALGWPEIPITRAVTEAPVLVYRDGWYHFFFSANTWDSPGYQILEVKAKQLRHLDITVRGSLQPGDVEYRIFQEPEAGEQWHNYGSGGAVQDKDGAWWYYMHCLPRGEIRYLARKAVE